MRIIVKGYLLGFLIFRRFLEKYEINIGTAPPANKAMIKYFIMSSIVILSYLKNRDSHQTIPFKPKFPCR